MTAASQDQNLILQAVSLSCRGSHNSSTGLIGSEATYVSPSSVFCGGCTLKSADCTSHAADDVLPLAHSKGYKFASPGTS